MGSSSSTSATQSKWSGARPTTSALILAPSTPHTPQRKLIQRSVPPSAHGTKILSSRPPPSALARVCRGGLAGGCDMAGMAVWGGRACGRTRHGRRASLNRRCWWHWKRCLALAGSTVYKGPGLILNEAITTRGTERKTQNVLVNRLQLYGDDAIRQSPAPLAARQSWIVSCLTPKNGGILRPQRPAFFCCKIIVVPLG